MVQGKNGLGGPNLVAKIGPARPKMVWCRISIEFIAARAASGVRPHFRYKCAAVSHDALTNHELISSLT